MRDKPECNHPSARYAYTIHSNGSKHWGKQCKTCGKWQVIAKKDVPYKYQKNATEKDRQLQEDWYQRIVDWRKQDQANRQAEWKKEQEEKNNAWWTSYNAYLKTLDWQDRRKKALERDGYLCQACLENRATQVHHRTYGFGFDAPLFVLISVCEECHNKIHSQGAL